MLKIDLFEGVFPNQDRLQGRIYQDPAQRSVDQDLAQQVDQGLAPSQDLNQDLTESINRDLDLPPEYINLDQGPIQDINHDRGLPQEGINQDQIPAQIINQDHELRLHVLLKAIELLAQRFNCFWIKNDY